MGEMFITINPGTEREVELPFMQAMALGRALKEFDGPAVWHFNQCGCCIIVHEHVEHPAWGYLIGADGGTDRVEAPHG